MTDEYTVLVTPEADADIQELYGYIAEALASPSAVSAHLVALRDAISSLSKMPMRHPLIEYELWRERGVRRVVVKNFNVYYLVNDGEKRVYVLAVIYGRRDQMKALGRGGRTA